MRKSINIGKIVSAQRKFVKERDWHKFHTPKNLVMALAGEVGELIELFQWLTPAESAKIMKNAGKRREVAHELADIFFHVVGLADKLGVDLEEAFWEKMRENRRKYPAGRVRGKARKYTDYR